MLAALLVATCICTAVDGKDPKVVPATRSARGAQEPVPTLETYAPEHAALERGLAYLAKQQTLTGDGSLTLGEESAFDSPIGITALAALAWMSAGNSPARGPHQAQVRTAIDYLLAHQAPPESAIAGYITDERDVKSQTHGHGLATLALAQAYSSSPSSPRGRRIAKALEAAVRRIEVSQGVDGGWEYSARRSVAKEGSVTICLVQALRAARNVGLKVDSQVIARAVKYVKSLQDETGGFMYSDTHRETSVALTAASLSTLHAIGIYDGPEVQNAYDYVWRKLELRRMDAAEAKYTSQSRFPFYERFYLSQALWQHRDESVFRRWAAEETKLVIVSQEKDGAWIDRRHEVDGRKVDGRYGSAYATAMNCLFLALPEGLLPIFQR
ncbi:MAG: hypothetical protein GY711_24315 [bacterium]|nr:hypothetical protein [bacterium]